MLCRASSWAAARAVRSVYLCPPRCLAVELDSSRGFTGGFSLCTEAAARRTTSASWPHAFVEDGATVGSGCVIGAGAVIHASAVVGKNCFVVGARRVFVCFFDNSSRNREQEWSLSTVP